MKSDPAESLLMQWTPPAVRPAFVERFRESLETRAAMERGFGAFNSGEPDREAFDRRLAAAAAAESAFEEFRRRRRRPLRVAAAIIVASVVAYALRPAPTPVAPLPSVARVKPASAVRVNYRAMWNKNRSAETLLALRSAGATRDLLEIARDNAEYRGRALDALASAEGSADEILEALASPRLRSDMTAAIRERGTESCRIAVRRAIRRPAPLGLEAMRLSAELADREALGEIQRVVRHCADRTPLAEAVPADASITPAKLLPGDACAARIREGIEAMASLGDRRAVPDLLRLASLESWRRPATDALHRISGKDLGPDPRAWREWWKSQT